ncbi:hypothetical protein [Roseofilum sp. Guam]|uniref:hypothetical protein n=1 Tax=Roseofilum sp. Guam TaxID=2821502 RepID=UPI001B1BA9F8|nr:hypothetical protein [Roseofilum sp. Guam]MBP0029242.1 hypothetical protein [Roseofilum sp. Guam]
MSKCISKETWWLDTGGFPDLHWARIQVFGDNTAEVLDMDGSRYQFDNEQEAIYFLLEDDYGSFNTLDEEDEQELGIPISSIQVPSGDSDDEIIKQMYIKRIP